MVQNFVFQQSQAGKVPQTIKNYLTPLTTMFKHAVQWGYLRNNPMPYVEKPRVCRGEMSFLSPTEVRRFLEQVQEEWYAFLLTAVMSGMRQGELLAMKWKNLDLDRKHYHVKERLYQSSVDGDARLGGDAAHVSGGPRDLVWTEVFDEGVAVWMIGVEAAQKAGHVKLSLTGDGFI